MSENRIKEAHGKIGKTEKADFFVYFNLLGQVSSIRCRIYPRLALERISGLEL
jgi:hypothetical protein